MASNGTQLAQQYVQIIPSANGIKGFISNLLGGEASDAGEKSGGLFGNGLVAKAMSIISVAAIGKALADSVMAGGALQQSIGGIETLFKDSAGTVEQYASQAYKTTGLSANAYMEQATSFAASLVSSLGGDTAKAAESANTALTDMADNSNKMGTAMESIQMAYQGFAKQNYTMLDNLKLGYGGTKTEMQRLLSDAQKITGVKYDISNLNDVYTAIHVIQGELGITGTTSKEAATTLTGSFNMMKASFTDFIGQLALGGDITPYVTNLVTSFNTFVFSNLIPMVGNIFTSIGPAIATGMQQLLTNLLTFLTDSLPTMIQQGSDLITNLAQGMSNGAPTVLTNIGTLLLDIMNTIINDLPNILDLGFQAIGQFATGLLNNLPTVISNIGTILQNLLSNILDKLPDILDSGMQLIEQLATGIHDNLPAILKAIGKVMGDLLKSILEHLPEILESGIELIGQLIVGLIKAIPDIIKAMPRIIAGISDSFSDFDWGQLGSSIIDGLVQGLQNAGGAIWDAITGICQDAWDGVKSFFGIGSPSRLMAYAGRMVDAGMANGLTQDSKNVQSAVDDINSIVSDGIVGNINSNISATSSYGTSASANGGVSYGGVTMIVNGAQGQDVSALADIVMDKIQNGVNQKGAVFR